MQEARRCRSIRLARPQRRSRPDRRWTLPGMREGPPDNPWTRRSYRPGFRFNDHARTYPSPRAAGAANPAALLLYTNLSKIRRQSRSALRPRAGWCSTFIRRGRRLCRHRPVRGDGIPIRTAPKRRRQCPQPSFPIAGSGRRCTRIHPVCSIRGLASACSKSVSLPSSTSRVKSHRRLENRPRLQLADRAAEGSLPNHGPPSRLHDAAGGRLGNSRRAASAHKPTQVNRP